MCVLDNPSFQFSEHVFAQNMQLFYIQKTMQLILLLLLLLLLIIIIIIIIIIIRFI